MPTLDVLSLEAEASVLAIVVGTFVGLIVPVDRLMAYERFDLREALIALQATMSSLGS